MDNIPGLDLTDKVVCVGDAAPSAKPSGDRHSSQETRMDTSQSISSTQVPGAHVLERRSTEDTKLHVTEGQEKPVEAEESSNAEDQNLPTDELLFDEESDMDDENALSHRLARHYRLMDSTWFDNKLEQRKANATRLAIQSNMHTQLIEDRLRALEKMVQTLMKIPAPEEEEDDKDVLQPLEHHLAIDHITWPTYSASVVIPESKYRRGKWLHRPEVDGIRKNVIEILIEEPQARIPHWASRNDSVHNINPSLYNPYSVRLRSPLILKLLERITKQKVMIGPHKHQLVLLRPFKLLIAYADKIFDFLQVLEDKLAGEPLNSDEDQPKQEVGNHAEAKQVDKAEKDKSPIPEVAKDDEAKKEKNGDTEVKEDDIDAQTETHEALLHMRLLKQLLTNDLGAALKLRQGVEAGTARKVSFPDLWHVFRYGQEVRSSGSQKTQLYRVLRFTGGRQSNEYHYTERDIPAGIASQKYKDEGYSKNAFVLECVYFDFNGTHFGPISKTFLIRKFEGEKAINSLPVYPLSLDPNHVKLRKDLLRRGERFAEIVNSPTTAHMQYRGLTLDKQPEQIESQIVIDFTAAFLQTQWLQPIIAPVNLVQHNPREYMQYYKCPHCTTPGCCGNDLIFPDYEVDEYFEDLLTQENRHFLDAVENPAEVKESQKVLFPCKVYGFVLRSRKWATFDIDLVEDVEYADGWDNLVIDKTVKETVLALVKNHARKPQQAHSLEGALSSVDLVRGKGKGLIILLHGEPGVGKTSTAECVADHTQRPLFPITCGDIGDNAESVEENLEKNFQLAHKWGCVLLLDEADVFLSKRTSSDLTRNAIVSVFLRTLEYYSGILFLTTNRVGNIDRAFKSRIHVALYYPKLSRDITYEIWKRNIKRIKADFKKENKPFVIEEKDILRFSKEHFKELKTAKLLTWNGRQIRNAFQTAIALAEYDASRNEVPVLNRKQFAKVAAASKDFDQYLKDTQKGKDDAQLAREDKTRVDEWGDYDPNSRMIEEGIKWASRNMPFAVSKPLQRRNSALPPNRRARNEELASEESSESDVTDITDESENVSADGGLESEAGPSKGTEEHSSNNSELSSAEEEEPAPKPIKTKSKSRSKDTVRASTSKTAEGKKAKSKDTESTSRSIKKKSK